MPAVDQFTIPRAAIERMPKPVQQAQAEVEAAAAALDKGRAEVARLRAEIQTAPSADAEALAAAVAADKPAPTPTLPDLEASADRASEAVEVLRKTLDGKRSALHHTVAANLPACLEAGNAQLTEQKSRAETLVAELADAVHTLEAEAGVLDGLRQADDYRERPGGERRLRDPGKIRWSRTRHRGDDALDEIRELLASFTPITETAGARREREDGEREGRRAQAARNRAAFGGGVYVGRDSVIQ